jgi:hypothetical protein
MGYVFLCWEVQRIERRQTMEGVPQRLLFNATRLDGSDDQVISIPSADLPVELHLDPQGILDSVQANGGATRVAKQVRRLGDLQVTTLTPDPFGLALDWAYRSYQVIVPKGASEPGDDWPFRKYLYLFNVLVSLEWSPSKQQLQRLEWAFRRASDFLFDVTDGWMAFGQVVFGGPELQAAADVQIMASNRLHPRAWVGGLHPNPEYERDEKFMPLRLGRGLWNDVRKGAIPWEEPEGYRIIIHEWGHYALKLIDEYLDARQVLFPANMRMSDAGDQALVPGSPITVITLKVPTTTDSIMATTEGTSELVTGQWPTLRTLYPRIPETRPDRDLRPGPDRLPLALPCFRRIAQMKTKQARAAQFFPRWDSSLSARFSRLRLPDDLPLDRCWVYVLKGITDQQLYPDRVIAQGTLEGRTTAAPFALLGAEINDTVVLIGEQRDQSPVVLSAKLTGEDRLDWRNATPPTLPAIDIVPTQIDPNRPRAEVRVRLNYLDTEATALPDQVCIFPLGQMPDQPGIPLVNSHESAWFSQPHDLPTLDGHILLRWPNEKLLITSFSQGGDGPNSIGPYPANPMNAGSADGNALLFMYKERDDDRPPNDIKVVTTIAHGMPHGPEGRRDRSYTFSIASNHPLPRGFNPTLLLYYDVFGEQEQPMTGEGDLRICRWIAGAAWKVLPTYLPTGFRFAVTPLDRDSGGALIDPAAQEPRVEYYKVCWVPRGE